VGDQLVLARTLERGERQQAGMVAEAAGDLGFLHRPRRGPGQARDQDRRLACPVGGGALGELQHRREQAGLADGELRGVDTDREPAGASVEIVARQRALPARVELAAGVERERMRRDRHAPAQRGEHLRRPVLPARCHQSLK
jgi:hypothetical protein